MENSALPSNGPNLSKPISFKKSNGPLRKPLVLSSERYGNILTNLNQNQNIQRTLEDEQKHKEFMKKESDKMVDTWSGSFKITQEQKLAERNEQIEERKRTERLEYQKIKEKDEEIRSQKIAKAEELIQQLKPGPKILQSASMQSEVLKVCAAQRELNEEIDKTLRKNKISEACHYERQIMPFIEEEQIRMADRQKRNNQYKAELLYTINENSVRRGEQSKQLLREQQVARDEMDQEIKAQIERERALQDKKRETLRRNAVEAMKMVEQRRLRECMENEVDDKLNAIYNNGKRTIDQLKQASEKQIQLDHAQRNELNAQKLINLLPAGEEDRCKGNISTEALKFTAEEQEKIKRDKLLKQARIERYMSELQAQKEAKERNTEERRFEYVNRIKNEEVNVAFKKMEQCERIQKMREHREALTEQIKERQEMEKLEKEMDRKCAITYAEEKDDKFFVDYASKLITHAGLKERPTYPLVKAVGDYQKEFAADINQATKLQLNNLVTGRQPHMQQCGDGVSTTEGRSSDTTSMASNSSFCTKNSSPIQRRYNMNELKRLNQYKH